MKTRDNLARVHVRLESGSDVLQARKRQALRHAQIVLVGMTADTAGGRPKVRLLPVQAQRGLALERGREEERLHPTAEMPALPGNFWEV